MACREQRLALGRWDDECGQSAGFWLVKAVPGLALCRHPVGWIVQADELVYDIYSLSPQRAWGEDFSTRPAYQLMDANPELDRIFTSRAEAALAVQQALAESEAPALAAVLG